VLEPERASMRLFGRMTWELWPDSFLSGPVSRMVVAMVALTARRRGLCASPWARAPLE